ncbi:C-terminal binding protein [Cohaesibacter haloalkalitolerans]|uniref:C-terminal binding protein n=1 Tax=Cohaesibacter haloalkalitolerans TaxID=1162980 RepID=UPI000E64E8FD|nr:C-terminal binding protein [Cohaesibacter haloalkalitolerans]
MKIVITDLDHADQNMEREVFAKAGMEFDLLECKTEDDLINQIKGYNIALNQYAPFTKRVFDALPDLKQIIRYGVGVNNVDLAAAKEAGVQVCNVPDYGMHEVSDHAIALSLSIIRKVPKMNKAVHNGVWDFTVAMPIRRFSQTTVGVVGLGRIGRLYAQKMHALGFNIVGFDKFYKPSAADGTDYIKAGTLDEVLASADIFAMFCPVTSENFHMIDKAAISHMKDGVYVVNTARGGLIDEDALAEALKSGKVAAAALDTTEIEPLPSDSPLRALDNCQVTPHMAWYSEDAALELKRKVAEEAVRFAKGESINWGLVQL